MKIEKGNITILSIFLFFFIVDTITTLMNKEYIIYLESNPIYLYFKSFIPIFILNIVLLIVIYLSYHKGSIDSRFAMINIIVWQSLARIVAIYNAINIKITQPAIETIKNIPVEAKISYYFGTVMLVAFVPLIFTYIAYLILKIDHKIVKKLKT